MTEELKKVADAITDEPVPVKIDILHPTRLEKLLFKLRLKKRFREFRVKPASLAKFIRISKLLLEVDVRQMDLKSIYGAIQGLAVSHGEKLAEVVAVAIHPGKDAPPRSLVAFLLDNLTNKEMREIAMVVLERGDATSFFGCIVSMKGINLLEMNQKDQAGLTPFGQLSAE